MRLAYGEGVIIAILAPLVVLLIGKITVLQTFFAIFALLGLWTLVSAFILMAEKDRMVYIAWGLILGSFSSAFIAPLQYAVALILVAIIAALLINVASRKNPQKTANVKLDQSSNKTN